MWNKIFKAMRNACVNFLSLYIVVIIYRQSFIISQQRWHKWKKSESLIWAPIRRGSS